MQETPTVVGDVDVNETVDFSEPEHQHEIVISSSSSSEQLRLEININDTIKWSTNMNGNITINGENDIDGNPYKILQFLNNEMNKFANNYRQYIYGNLCFTLKTSLLY